jgi:NhaP-type Na+/H+ or K+/H+ antiporter
VHVAVCSIPGPETSLDIPPLTLLAGIVGLGVTIQLLASRFKLPSIVFLLLAGLALGPLFGVLRPSEQFGELLEPLVSLAVAMVLFEGSLSLRVSEARRLGRPLWSLTMVGLICSFTLTTLAGVGLAGLSWPVAAVIGSILVVTGPTVIKPMLRQARLPKRPALLLRWEGIVNDPLGALMAVVVLEIALIGADAGNSWAPSLLAFVGLALAMALAGCTSGWLLGKALSRGWIAEHLKAPAIVAAALVTHAGAESLLHESGLLAVTAMGVVLANIEHTSLEAIRQFKENVATLLVAVLFLVLAADLSFDDLTTITPGAGVLVLVVLFVVRPLSVWLALAGSDVPWNERLLIGWIAPRGIVAAAMAGALAPELERAGFEDARLILPVLFGVIFLTVVLHSLTIRPLARRLGLASPSGDGLLIVGISIWACELAKTLGEASVEVLMVDSDRRAVLRARMMGIEAHHGDVISEETLDDLPLERIQSALSATPDDHYNSLACLALRPVLGSEQTLQLTPTRADEAAPHLEGRAPWGADGSFDKISSRFWRSRKFRSTQLTEQFGWGDFWEQNPEALVLFAVGPKGITAVDSTDEPAPDCRIVYAP